MEQQVPTKPCNATYKSDSCEIGIIFCINLKNDFLWPNENKRLGEVPQKITVAYLIIKVVSFMETKLQYWSLSRAK
jgi:hypothetical protein